MTARRALIACGVAVVTVAVVVAASFAVSRWRKAATPAAGVAAAAPAPAPPGRKIKARLFYVADDGVRLNGVEHDVAFREGPVEQAREIIAAQIAPVADPLVSAVPAGTTLRALFVTERGEAYVDLSPEVRTGHPGGSLAETLTVYALVNALTANLPAITSVQLLVEGKEVETLSGHVDLRHPLSKNLAWVQ